MFALEKASELSPLYQAVGVSWTDDVNKASNISGIGLYAKRTISHILSNPDSEVLEADFRIITTVTLVEK